MGITKDWIVVGKDENLSNAEREGFSKKEVDMFLQGYSGKEMEKEKILDDLV